MQDICFARDWLRSHDSGCCAFADNHGRNQHSQHFELDILNPEGCLSCKVGCVG